MEKTIFKNMTLKKQILGAMYVAAYESVHVEFIIS